MNAKSVAVEVATATPSVTNLTLSVFGVPLQSWIMILSAVLILCQLFWLFYNNIVRKKDGPTQSTNGGSASD